MHVLHGGCSLVSTSLRQNDELLKNALDRGKAKGPSSIHPFIFFLTFSPRKDEDVDVRLIGCNGVSLFREMIALQLPKYVILYLQRTIDRKWKLRMKLSSKKVS